MSYDTYMSDGVSGRWWTYKSDEELDFEEIEQENIKKLAIEKNKEQIEKNISILNAFNADHFSCAELKNVLFKRISRRGVLYAAHRYCKLERLPKDYAALAVNNCRVIDVLNLNLSGIFTDTVEIDEFEKNIKGLSKFNEGAYDRVTKVQRVIHEKCIQKNGDKSHLELPKEPMRIVLSYTRLHFLIRDLENYQLNDFNRVLVRNQLERTIDATVPLYLFESKRKFIPRWSSRFRNTIYFYFKENDRLFIKNIIQIDDCLRKTDLITYLSSRMPATTLL